MAFEDDEAEEPVADVQIVFEGDADASHPELGSVADEIDPAPTHVVGNDRLANLVTAVGDSVAELREQRRSDAMAGVGGGVLSTVLPERIAQIIQGTLTPLDVVVALLNDGIAGAAHGRPLRIEAGTAPTVLEGVASYRGSLRLSRPPTRRPVDLRVYPTASGNLTVLELLPRRRWIPQTERYLSAGVPAITELTDAIENAARAAGV